MRTKLLVVVLHDLLHVVLVADGFFLIFRHRVSNGKLWKIWQMAFDPLGDLDPLLASEHALEQIIISLCSWDGLDGQNSLIALSDPFRDIKLLLTLIEDGIEDF